MKISSLELENVKRVKSVILEPAGNGLTVIGGKNGQGKTSVLDGIAWALGGDKYRPTNPQREGAVVPPYLRVVLSNGLIVERKGKNSDLKVLDPTGKSAGQQLLNDFVEQFAINLPKFLNSSSRDKAETLLQIIGVGDKLYELERRESELYNKRHAIGQIADQKKKFAAEMICYPDAPEQPVSAAELIWQQQEILARNGENQRKRENLRLSEQRANDISEKISGLKKQLKMAEDELTVALADLENARKTAVQLHDESTQELEANIADVEKINIKVRANLDKNKAEEDAAALGRDYDELTEQLNGVRAEKVNLLQNANLPLQGLSVENGELVYNGSKWDCMSGSEQLKVATAIVRKLNPKCEFVLLDKIEQMDIDTLREFGTWLEGQGLQAIATRVGTGDECSVIIEDGRIIAPEVSEVTEAGTAPKQWKAGVF